MGLVPDFGGPLLYNKVDCLRIGILYIVFESLPIDGSWLESLSHRRAMDRKKMERRWRLMVRVEKRKMLMLFTKINFGSGPD